ncbi:hypothetical protein OG21DRAFT_1492236 [Imleria badia]|nr:hypothetical protein OG21DRAFT_1492236 [Imleria badia]
MLVVTPPKTPLPLELLPHVHFPFQNLAHSLGHPSNADFAALVAAIEDAHLAIPVDSYLDVESPHYERLHFIHSSVPDSPEFHLARLLITMIQLGMLEFFQDEDRYLQELAGAPLSTSPIPPPVIPVPEETPSSPTQTPSASSSPLDSNKLEPMEKLLLLPPTPASIKPASNVES